MSIPKAPSSNNVVNTIPLSKLHVRVFLLAALMFLASVIPSAAQTIVSPTPSDINVRADGAIELNGTASGFLSNVKELTAGLKKLITKNEKSTTKYCKSLPPESICYRTPVVIRVDESLNYGSIVDLLVSVRAAGADSIKVEASHMKDNPFVTIPQEPNPAQDLSLLKPNPLTLVVRIHLDGRLYLNQEPYGTSANPSTLKQKLADLFQNRAKYGAFRTGTQVVEKTVYVDAARALSFGDVVKIVDVVKQAGAEPTGLKIDDLLP